MPDAHVSGGRPKALVLVGTRPEAIKMAPVFQALSRKSHLLETRLALTGQHDEMVDQVLTTFGMGADYDLGIMRPGQTLYDVAHGCLDGLRGVAQDFRPDITLVQGDTATVFFGTLVAFFEGLAVGHVEAGLRSGQKWAPYPEEMFRRLADVLTDIYFPPTPLGRDNLLAEGVPEDRIHVTGNTVVDALQATSVLGRTPTNPELKAALEGGRRLVLLTAHRRESLGEPLVEVFSAVRELVDRDEGVEVLYPVHPNPKVSGPAEEHLSGHPRIRLTKPLNYLDLVSALERAVLVLTDSGGIQEEAPTFGVPVLVLRDVTERPEGVEAGAAFLVGTRKDRILGEAMAALDRHARGRGGEGPANPYGDGHAAARIADIVASELTGNPRETTDWGGA